MRKASQAVISAWTFLESSWPGAERLRPPEGFRVEGREFKRVRRTAAAARSRQLVSASHCSAMPGMVSCRNQAFLSDTA